MAFATLAVALSAPAWVVPTTVEAQLSVADTRCRRALHSGAQRLYRTTLAKQASCHRLRMLGKLSPLRDCSDPDRLPSSLILDVIEDHLVRRAQNACRGFPPRLGFETCPPPCANIELDRFSDVGRCLACQAKEEARATTANIYGRPPVPGSNTDAVRCQNALGSENIRYATSLMTSHRRCQFLQDRGAISPRIDCRREDFFRIFTRAREVLTRRIDRLCTFAQTTTLDGCKDDASQVECLLSQSQESTDLLYRQVYQADDFDPGKVVFVTSKAYTGAEIGGIAGADAICGAAAEASEERLDGRYRAWLSDGTISPQSRFTKASQPYVLVDGSRVAGSYAELVTIHPEVAITGDENGNIVAFERPVWTGTAADGNAASGATCDGWTSDAGRGVIGLPYFIGGGLWTDSQEIDCARPAHLYCFEQ